jgi:hypothetical protein
MTESNRPTNKDWVEHWRRVAPKLDEIRRRELLLFEGVREVLFREWDPIGVNNQPLAQDEYDSYARRIVGYLNGEADEYKIAHYLSEVQRNSMGMSNIDGDNNRRIARRLLELKR